MILAPKSMPLLGFLVSFSFLSFFTLLILEISIAYRNFQTHFSVSFFGNQIKPKTSATMPAVVVDILEREY